MKTVTVAFRDGSFRTIEGLDLAFFGTQLKPEVRWLYVEGVIVNLDEVLWMADDA